MLRAKDFPREYISDNCDVFIDTKQSDCFEPLLNFCLPH